MKNDDKFKQIFGFYATELFAMSDKDFLTWLITKYNVSDTNADDTDRLRELPTIDAVPVVRCKDCKWGKEKAGNIECNVDINVPSEYHGYEWFCPIGERKEDATN